MQTDFIVGHVRCENHDCAYVGECAGPVECYCKLEHVQCAVCGEMSAVMAGVGLLVSAELDPLLADRACESEIARLTAAHWAQQRN